MRQSLKTGSSGSQQYERVAAPGSPSKRHPEATSHSISLHPIIPEETPADMGSAMSGRADHSTTNSAGQDAILSGGRVNKVNQKTTSTVGATRQGADDDNSMVATESYGGAGNTSKVMVHDSTDRNNSTAKSQKRQQMQQQQ